MEATRNLQAVHTSNFIKNKKAEKAFLEIERRGRLSFINIKLKSKINKK